MAFHQSPCCFLPKGRGCPYLPCHEIHFENLIVYIYSFLSEILGHYNCGIYSLHLQNNSFTGKFSRLLKNCRDLIILDLGENNFTGRITSWLGESMPTLGVLSLKSNKLYGALLSSLCHLAKLQVLDISENNISGTIPKYPYQIIIVGNLTCSTSNSARIMWKGKMAEYAKAFRLLTLIDLSSNNLTGEIPVEVTSLVGLLAFNLSRNNLVGTIPRDIGRLELLNFLNLFENNLSGRIPPTLSQLCHLGMLNLSFNNFLDEMPKKPKSTNNVHEVHENNFFTRGFYISMALNFTVAFWGVCGTLLLNKWCWITVPKMFIRFEDWFYVNMLVNKNRTERHFEKH
ncbi:Leucine-rich repeat (LRR) protein associated with apoptosis in muscle tissue [Handroanthus impetiginosus]|uniref:Leucine-rich repeat (LRR) protein associated with apoptosis in muscle tissue n=1 Tax=Handroanthus impetiginosus TaxID=429701 RepID=A0A2G9GVB7_9LAMI|nr:Leucine-rich repeat (LRR) protein associated with apoptosis in muscle tissue [Handroanthus impetiginosus]